MREARFYLDLFSQGFFLGVKCAAGRISEFLFLNKIKSIHTCICMYTYSACTHQQCISSRLFLSIVLNFTRRFAFVISISRCGLFCGKLIFFHLHRSRTALQPPLTGKPIMISSQHCKPDPLSCNAIFSATFALRISISMVCSCYDSVRATRILYGDPCFRTFWN